MTTIAPITSPAEAISIWSDNSRIYANLGGAIIAYPLTEGGLGKILLLLKARPVTYTTTISIRDERGARAKAMLRKLGALG